MTSAEPVDESFFHPRQRLYMGLSAFFVASWLLGDLTGGKYFTAFGRDLSVGMIPFPLTFVLTDLIHEFYGPRGAKQVTYVAAAMAAYVFVLLQVMVALPTARLSVVPGDVFSGAFGQSIRLFGASLTAFLIGQLVDVRVFHAIRARTGKQHVWLRANGSTAVSQVVDTVVINTLFLAGQAPTGFIVDVIVNSYAAKIVAAIALTPLLYLVHGVVERKLAGEPMTTRGMRRGFALAAVGGLALYLLAFPTGVAPISYQPPRNVGFSGPFAPRPLGQVRREAPQWVGPEALAFDDDGRLFAGLADGRIVMRGRRGKMRDIVDTGGRPLGMVASSARRLVVADAERGLLEVDTDHGHARSIVRSFENRRLRFTDDVTRTPDGTILFTDASTRWGIRNFRNDIVEHRGTGRIFAVDVNGQRARLLVWGLQFANGIAASKDGSYVVFCETGAYRLRRLELTGPQRGRLSTVVEVLPGFCDNIRRDPERDVFWVAIVGPRNAILDATARRPLARSVIVRLPEVLQPSPPTRTAFVAVDGTGRVLYATDQAGPYGPVTTVLPHEGKLYLGSLSAAGYAIVDQPRLP